MESKEQVNIDSCLDVYTIELENWPSSSSPPPLHTRQHWLQWLLAPPTCPGRSSPTPPALRRMGTGAAQGEGAVRRRKEGGGAAARRRRKDGAGAAQWRREEEATQLARGGRTGPPRLSRGGREKDGVAWLAWWRKDGGGDGTSGGRMRSVEDGVRRA